MERERTTTTGTPRGRADRLPTPHAATHAGASAGPGPLAPGTGRRGIALTMLTALAVLAVCALPAPARGADAAGPAGQRLDWARWSWATPSAEREARGTLVAALDALRREARTPPRSGAQLLRLLEHAGAARRLAGAHGDYLHLRAAVDTRDEASASAEDSVDTMLDSSLAAVHARLARLAPAALARWIAAEPRLGPYRAYLADAREEAAHELPDALRPLGTTATAWPFDLYERLVDRTDFGTVAGPDGPLDVRRQRAALDASPDSALRETAFVKLGEGYARQRDLYAFALLQAVRAQDALALACGYPDAPARVYAERHVTVAQVRALAAAVRAHGAIYRRFEAALDRSRRVLASRPPPRITRAGLAAVADAAMRPLGPAWAEEFRALLDPANALLDLGPGEHRQPGGFSFVLPGGRHGVYLEAFEGYATDASRLVHECGHAAHKHVFEGSGAPGVTGPALSEAVAQFGEVVVMDELARAAKDPADALYWRQQFLRKLLETFLGARDAELEQAFYDGVRANTLADADDLDRLTARVDSAYTSDRRPQTAARWMRTGLFEEDPLYMMNYLYSGTILVAMYQEHVADPADLARRWAAFLRTPDTEPPSDVVRRTLGVDLADARFMDAAMATVAAQVGRFEADLDRLAAAGERPR